MELKTFEDLGKSSTSSNTKKTPLAWVLNQNGFMMANENDNRYQNNHELVGQNNYVDSFNKDAMRRRIALFW